MTRVRLRPEARREQLLDVAAELIATQGLPAVTMERVAEHAGVSRGLGYAYFPDRHHLLGALLEREAKRVAVTVAQAVAGGTGVEGKFRAAVHAYFAALDRSGRVMQQLLQAPSLQGPARAKQREGQAALEDQLTPVLTRFLRLSRAEAKAFVVIILRALPAASAAVASDAIGRDEAEDVFAELALGGLDRLVKRRGKAR